MQPFGETGLAAQMRVGVTDERLSGSAPECLEIVVITEGGVDLPQRKMPVPERCRNLSGEHRAFNARTLEELLKACHLGRRNRK